MPASRRARATIFAPRSWPSRPGLATNTRMRRSGIPFLIFVVFVAVRPQTTNERLHVLEERCHGRLQEPNPLAILGARGLALLKERRQPVQPLIDAVQHLTLHHQIVFDASQALVMRLRGRSQSIQSLIDGC